MGHIKRKCQRDILNEKILSNNLANGIAGNV